MIPLHEITTVPDGLLSLTDAVDLHRVLPHPTLLHLEGARQHPLFITVLLHGNEDTGLFAVQRLLRKYADHPLPRSISIFFGNVYAAAQRQRRLPEQPDYNRVWPGGDAAPGDETRLIAEVMDIMTQKRPFASVDIHNNTGKNPHYGCINRLDTRSLHLASLFGRTVVYFETPRGVQSMAMAECGPAVTVECGKPGAEQGTEHAFNYVDTLLHLESLDPHHFRRNDVDVYHTIARVCIPDAVTFSFDDPEADLQLLRELENDNFCELTGGTLFARIRPGSAARFEAYDDEGRERAGDFFTHSDETIRLGKTLMPSMITLDEQIIRQDCFCYLMERLTIPEPDL